jgi:predicted TIM-barrel fold metal-dependent hydrolase
MTMRTITLEEHDATPAFMDGPGRQIREEARAASAHPRVAAGLARLVEQLGPAEAVAFARDTNDTLAEAVRRHPDRLAGLAALPTAAPEAAARPGTPHRGVPDRRPVNRRRTES